MGELPACKTTKPYDDHSLTHKVILFQIYKALLAIGLVSYVATGYNGHSTAWCIMTVGFFDMSETAM